MDRRLEGIRGTFLKVEKAPRFGGKFELKNEESRLSILDGSLPFSFLEWAFERGGWEFGVGEGGRQKGHQSLVVVEPSSDL